MPAMPSASHFSSSSIPSDIILLIFSRESGYGGSPRSLKFLPGKITEFGVRLVGETGSSIQLQFSPFIELSLFCFPSFSTVDVYIRAFSSFVYFLI